MKTMKTKQEKNQAIQNGKGWLSTITDIAKRLESEDENERESAREEACQSILEIQVRSGWHSLGETAPEEEFFILLSAGGPALRIRGDLDRGEPSDPVMEWQDWGTLWTEMALDSLERKALQAFCGCFYFGE